MDQQTHHMRDKDENHDAEILQYYPIFLIAAYILGVSLINNIHRYQIDWLGLMKMNTIKTYSENPYNQEDCGLFKIRNSHGSNVANHGNFYMTYDYFKALTNHAISVGR